MSQASNSGNGNSQPANKGAAQEPEQTISVFGHKVAKSDLIKIVGLVAFIVILGVIVAALWPSLSVVFEEDGVNKLIERIQGMGAAGVLVLLGLQLLQIIVAFIPGEVVQVAAGMLYGPLFGSIIILFGCVISSALIYELVHRLGAPFVRSMVSEEHMVKFYEFERSGKLNVIVFILFVIPGMPKDVFTYLVPLTNMRMRNFLLITTIARIPGVIISTYAAAGLADGDVQTSLIIFGIAAVLCLLGIVFRERIMSLFAAQKTYHHMEEKREELVHQRAEEMAHQRAQEREQKEGAGNDRA